MLATLPGAEDTKEMIICWCKTQNKSIYGRSNKICLYGQRLSHRGEINDWVSIYVYSLPGRKKGYFGGKKE